MREFSLHDGFITGTLLVPTLPRGPKPAIVQPVVDPDRLLARGLVVVRYRVNWKVLGGLAEESGAATVESPPADAAAPGNTVGKWLLAAPRPGLVGSGYFGLIAANARRILPTVMDHLESVSDIDPRRIALAGSSTNGFVALEALVVEPRLAAVAVRVACGDYHEFLRASSLALAGDERWLVEGKLLLDADYEARLREQEPIRFADRLPPRPLLLLNGARDPAVPVACARETARVFARAYARSGVPERFRFVVYDERGHDLGPDAEREILAWWDRWLNARRETSERPR